MSKSTSVIWPAVIVVMIAGCATIDEPDRTEFLSDYSNLEEISENHLLYDSGNLGDYSKFIIEPIALLNRQAEEDQVFTYEQLEELREYYRVEITSAIVKDDGYQLTSLSGPGTAKIRVAITDVDNTIGALNVLIYTKVTGAGLGGAAIEGEIVDAQSGEQIMAVTRWGTGSRVLRAGLTETGDAKIVVDRWAEELRGRFDESHNR